MTVSGLGYRAVSAGICLLAFGFGVPLAGASAQDLDRTGVRAGAFLIEPSLQVGLGYDDNVFAVETGEESDVFYTIRPRLSVSSLWSVHRLEAEIGLNGRYFSDLTDESTTDWYAGMSGRLDVTRATALFGEARYERLAEARGDTNLPGTVAEPTRYDRYAAALRLVHAVGRTQFTLGGSAVRLTFDDTDLIGGGVLDNSVRDRVLLSGFARIDHEFSPGYSVFARALADQRSYDENASDFRDSSGYEVAVGIAAELTNLIEGEAFIGYTGRDYDGFASEDTFALGASLDWSVTRLTTISLGASRQIEETTEVGSSGYIATSVDLSVRHALTRFIELGGSIGYSDNAYDGIDRDEDVFRAGVSARYFFNPHAAFSASYDYSERTSSVPNADYARNLFQVGVVLRY